MRIFPNPEHAEQPINRNRNERKKKPVARQRFGFFDGTKKRIDNKSCQKSEINAETPRTRLQRRDFPDETTAPAFDDIND